MNEYVLVFRMDITTPAAQPPPEQMKDYMAAWMAWVNRIAADDRLAAGGHHLSSTTARLLRPHNTVLEGPYTANHESIAGYIVIRATGIDDATRIAQRCPILQGEGTSVEVRETGTPAEMEKARRTGDRR